MNLKEMLEKIEIAFNRDLAGGVMVISKSQDEEESKKLVNIFDNYLRKIGYDTLIHEDDKDHNISYVLPLKTPLNLYIGEKENA